MSNNIKRSNGQLVNIADSVINRDYSVGLVGDLAENYTSSVAQSSLQQLENFASDVPPERNRFVNYNNINDQSVPSVEPLTGQLWYDTAAEKLKVYNGSQSSSSFGWTEISQDATTLSIVPNYDEQQDIGSSNKYWHFIYGTHMKLNTNRQNGVAGVPHTADTSPALEIDGNVLIENTNVQGDGTSRIAPANDGGLQIGDNAHYAKKVYSKEVIFGEHRTLGDEIGFKYVEGSENVNEGFIVTTTPNVRIGKWSDPQGGDSWRLNGINVNSCSVESLSSGNADIEVHKNLIGEAGTTAEFDNVWARDSISNPDSNEHVYVADGLNVNGALTLGVSNQGSSGDTWQPSGSSDSFFLQYSGSDTDDYQGRFQIRRGGNDGQTVFTDYLVENRSLPYGLANGKHFLTVDRPNQEIVIDGSGYTGTNANRVRIKADVTRVESDYLEIPVTSNGGIMFDEEGTANRIDISDNSNASSYRRKFTKSITVNDGTGNFNIRNGNYAGRDASGVSDGDRYAEGSATDNGASKITLWGDGGNGSIEMKVASTGVLDDEVDWTNTVTIDIEGTRTDMPIIASSLQAKGDSGDRFIQITGNEINAFRDDTVTGTNVYDGLSMQTSNLVVGKSNVTKPVNIDLMGVGSNGLATRGTVFTSDTGDGMGMDFYQAGNKRTFIDYDYGDDRTKIRNPTDQDGNPLVPVQYYNYGMTGDNLIMYIPQYTATNARWLQCSLRGTATRIGNVVRADYHCVFINVLDHDLSHSTNTDHWVTGDVWAPIDIGFLFPFLNGADLWDRSCVMQVTPLDDRVGSGPGGFYGYHLKGSGESMQVHLKGNTTGLIISASALVA